ncbi:hypothetical protein JW964_03950 [candidate division KSB1 bacterium]|nr:hypothetical protein [candidate division KSB1 bacterium]
MTFKHHLRKLKLSITMILLFVTGLNIFNFSCNKQNPASTELERNMEALKKPATYTFETIRPELEKILTFLIQNPNIMTPTILARAVEGYVTIDDIGLTSKFPTQFCLDNGNIFEVCFEIFRGSRDNASNIENTDAYITLDLDRYPAYSGLSRMENGAGFTAFAAATEHNKQKGLYQDSKNQHQLNLRSNSEKVNYLLIFVGGEEKESVEFVNNGIQKKNSSNKQMQSTLTEYIWLTKIQLKATKDYSNEEFELYQNTSNASVERYASFQYFTNLKFNGGEREDLSGYDRVFPDINNTGTYTPSHAIAVAYSANQWKLVAIEDDYSSGKHWNDVDYSPDYHQENNMYGTNISGSSYSTFSNYSFWFRLDGDVQGDDDDIYENSLIRSYSTPVPTTETYYPTSHVNYWFRRGTVTDADNW